MHERVYQIFVYNTANFNIYVCNSLLNISEEIHEFTKNSLSTVVTEFVTFF